MTKREIAEYITAEAIRQVLPDNAVKKALNDKLNSGGFGNGRLIVVAIGKAGWQMAKTACEILGDKIHAGICITKYGHVYANLPRITCIEAGHPVPDDNSFRGTDEAISLVKNLTPEDTVLFLVSGGGSALFESPLISPIELKDITEQLLGCGADIVEINTIRKRLSAVKGGRFAKLCEPARVFSIVLSDIVGDPLDMIASGPAFPDSSTCSDALSIIKKYDLKLSKEALQSIMQETPKSLSNVETCITGSVRNLCKAAKAACEILGYDTAIITDCLTGEAKTAGRDFGKIALSNPDSDVKRAFIIGGETVVHITGTGKGGRNQEFALAAAEVIAGLKNVCVFSVGSDGTDGPTDAAGGFVDGTTAAMLKATGYVIKNVLADNDSYNALKAIDGLIVTGPTGTNVNDFAVLLIN